MELRKDQRFPVQFKSSFSSVNMAGGEGTVLNISIGGCKVTSLAPVNPGTVLVLRLHVAEEQPILEISKAAVRWSRGGEFGVEFIDMQPAAWASLRQFIKALESGVTSS